MSYLSLIVWGCLFGGIGVVVAVLLANRSPLGNRADKSTSKQYFFLKRLQRITPTGEIAQVRMAICIVEPMYSIAESKAADRLRQFLESSQVSLEGWSEYKSSKGRLICRREASEEGVDLLHLFDEANRSKEGVASKLFKGEQ